MFGPTAVRVKNSDMRKRHDRTGAHGSDRIVEQLHIDDIEMRLARNRRRLERIIEETEAYIARGEVAPPVADRWIARQLMHFLVNLGSNALGGQIEAGRRSTGEFLQQTSFVRSTHVDERIVRREEFSDIHGAR